MFFGVFGFFVAFPFCKFGGPNSGNFSPCGSARSAQIPNIPKNGILENPRGEPIREGGPAGWVGGVVWACWLPPSTFTHDQPLNQTRVSWATLGPHTTKVTPL